MKCPGFYAGSVFVKNALRDLKNRHLGMDVPVALSISLAYFFSVWHVLQGDTQAIYFDSMVMFVFFLLAGRHLEMGVRHKGMNAREALASMVPVSVRRVVKDVPMENAASLPDAAWGPKSCRANCACVPPRWVTKPFSAP